VRFLHLKVAVNVSKLESAHFLKSCNFVEILFKVLAIQNRFRYGTHLFVKIPRPRDSEVTFSVFELSCHLLLQYKSNYSKVQAITLDALPKDTSKLAGLSPH